MNVSLLILSESLGEANFPFLQRLPDALVTDENQL